MASPPRCWRRGYTRHSDHGYGLYATQEISQGKTILTEFPETFVHINRLDGQQDLPNDVVLGGKTSSLDSFHVARQQAILGKKPKLLYLSFPQSSGNPRNMDEGVGIFGADEEFILVMPSAVNHSCAPNMFRIDSVNLQTRRLKCRFVATRNIRAGEQLTISYDPRLSKWELPHTRRALLSEEYGFFCRCRKCVSQSGWRDLMLLSPVPTDKMRQYMEDDLDSEASMLPLPQKKYIVRPEAVMPLKRLVDNLNIPMDGARSPTVATKVLRKERMNLWLETASHRTKAWLKSVPGEMKITLGGKVLVEDPDPPVLIVALDDNRNEDGTLSSKVFRLENVVPSK